MGNMPCHKKLVVSGVGKVEGVHLLIPNCAGMLHKQAFEYGLLNDRFWWESGKRSSNIAFIKHEDWRILHHTFVC
jgi:hypothetical protein